MNRIGILGGTFDPVHLGHLLLAENAREQAELDKVLFMPTHIQPFKQDIPVSPDGDRIMMLALALKGDKNFSVSRVEIDDPDISYTIVSLERLREEWDEDTKIYFITGSDMFINIDKWHRSEDLLRRFSFIVGMRTGETHKEVDSCLSRWKKEFGTEVIKITNPVCDISSSDIRRRVAEKLSIRYLVPENVRDYIFDANLYRVDFNGPQIRS